MKSSYAVLKTFQSFLSDPYIIFDKSGKFLYGVKNSSVIKLNIDNGQVEQEIPSPNEDDLVIRFTVTPDESLIIIAYRSGLISKINLANLTILRTFKSIHSAPISSLKCDEESKYLATGSSDGTVKLWHLNNHYCSHNLRGVSGVVSCIEFFKDESKDLLICSGGDDCIHIYDLTTSTKIAKLSSHISTITSLAFTKDKTCLISVGRDKICVVWNLNDSSKPIGSIQRVIPLYESVESVLVFGDMEPKYETFFATIGEEGVIKIWETKGGSQVLIQGSPALSTDRLPRCNCSQLLVRPEHKQLCLVTYDMNLFFYKLPNFDLVHQLQGHIDTVFSACWFGKHNSHLALATNSSDLKVIDTETSNSQHHKGHTDLVLCVRCVPSDTYTLITSAKDCSVLVWKFDTHTMKPTILYKGTGHTHDVHSIAVSHRTKTFFTGSEDSTVKSWSMKELKSKTRMSSLEHEVPIIAVQTIKAHEDRIDALAVSPNDEFLASGSKDKTAKVFSVRNMKLLGTLNGHKRGIYNIQFSPTDQVLVTSSGDSTLKMWNLQDFTCMKTFQGHECSVLNFLFLSTGLQILSLGSDGNMKIWDCKTSECTKTIDAHDGNVWALSKTDDEEYLITAGQDEKIVIWKDNTEVERETKLESIQACMLKEQEFSNFINKKVWKKAMNLAVSLENENKTLRVIKEILLQPNGLEELRTIIGRADKIRLNFFVECCVQWAAHTKNALLAQSVLNCIFKTFSYNELISLPAFTKSIGVLLQLTEKTYDRYEKLVQEATFVDFLFDSFKIQ